MWAQILCYKNQGIHWYHCNPTFLWQINFTLVRRLISALIWDISGQWNRSDGRDFREKRIDISRFLAPYEKPTHNFIKKEQQHWILYWRHLYFWCKQYREARYSSTILTKIHYSNQKKNWILFFFTLCIFEKKWNIHYISLLFKYNSQKNA